jgi:hypothetical protein
LRYENKSFSTNFLICIFIIFSLSTKYQFQVSHCSLFDVSIVQSRTSISDWIISRKVFCESAWLKRFQTHLKLKWIDIHLWRRVKWSFSAKSMVITLLQSILGMIWKEGNFKLFLEIFNWTWNIVSNQWILVNTFVSKFV